MQIYLVGGAVRDQLLGLSVIDHDWVVVGGTPEELVDQGFRQIDPEFPVFSHPETGEEYALARRETKISAGFRGFEVDTSSSVTLQEDLRRRDLTINAIARGQDGSLIDPYGGQDDLREGFLRHVSPAFSEDPVRLIRVARFAARFGEFGFRLAHDTHRLMKQMVIDGAMSELKAERSWQEMYKAMAYSQPWRFVEVLNACGALAEWLPKLAQQMQLSGEHRSSPDCPAVAALKRVTEQAGGAETRLATLMVQSGESLKQLRKSVALNKVAADLIEVCQRLWPAYQTLADANAERVLTFLSDCRAWQNPERFDRILQVLSAQHVESEIVPKLKRASVVSKSVNVTDLQALGLSGAALGEGLAKQRLCAIEEVW